ncbi:MAG: hypothetical protein Q9204_000142 [Flavoplaca sp. TL-2023a]
MHSPSGSGKHAYEAAFRYTAQLRQAGPEHISMARDYLSTIQALDGSEDGATALQKACLLCINNRREAHDLPPLSSFELDEHLDMMVVRVVDSLRKDGNETSPGEIMQRFNDELIGIMPAEREQFLVLDSWKIREKKGDSHGWPDWVMKALEAGDLRSDFWGTEVNRERRDLIEYLLCEPGDEAVGGT